MQQRTWLLASRRVKYQCPLEYALHCTTSPRTQSWMPCFSIKRLTDALS
jgi:hypothetical protein